MSTKGKSKAEKEELISLVKSTAEGSLASNERCKKAMKKGLEAIGLLHSMVLSSEIHGSKSEEIVLEAVGLLHDALKFMSEKPKMESGGLGVWGGTPEMAKEFIKYQGRCSENNCDCRLGKSLDVYCDCKCHDVPSPS